ncbi:MAG: HAD family phosphatase [Nanoarchaeales archaeon]|nr:HAD family phosphatase [Nanoarchaeales archaeon]
MSKLKGILFDFDGTIVNSEESRYQSIKHILKEFKINFTKSDWETRYKSFGTTKIFEIFKKQTKANWNCEELYDKAHKFRMEYEKSHGVPIISGFNGFLEQLKQNNISSIVCTGGKTSHFDFVLNLTKLDIQGFGREFYTNRKPAPDCWEYGLKKLNLKKENVLIFDDSFTGLQAGNNANIKAIAINCSEDISNLQIWQNHKNYKNLNLKNLIKEFENSSN